MAAVDQRFFHWQGEVAVAADARFVAERLFQGLTKSDPNIFDGVVLIDVQIALCLHVQINRRVLRQQREHVVEEPDAGGNLALPGAIEIQLNANLGFSGFTIDGGSAGHKSKYEIRISKFELNSKYKWKTLECRGQLPFRDSNFELHSNFGFRSSNFTTIPCRAAVSGKSRFARRCRRKFLTHRPNRDNPCIAPTRPGFSAARTTV